jgi:UDP-N-acetylmuramoyl-tripeptide--D-alanyl-D-alanine ligase
MLTLQLLQKITNAKLLQSGPQRKIDGICTDSRSLKPGNVFIAIRGEKFNGHKFLKDVTNRGASVLIVSQSSLRFPVGVPILKVDDTVRAFGQIASFHRGQFHIPVIALTGSSGKTTTKEMIADVLSAKYKVLKNIKTENNHMGVPATLLKLDDSYDIAVIEFGTNQFGDIKWLTDIAKPNVAVFTNIGDSHLEKLKNRSGVFKEKFNLVRYMNPKGTVIFNMDDLFLKKIERLKICQKKISYSTSGRSFIQAKQIQFLNHRWEFKVKNDTFSLNTFASHNISNALAAIAVGYMFKIPSKDIKNKLLHFKNCGGRQDIKRMQDLTIIDDTYNSNPTSFKSAVDALGCIKTTGQKIVVCSDMLELGRQSKNLHAQMGKYIARSNTDVLLTNGRWAKYIYLGAKASKMKNCGYFKTLDELHSSLAKICSPADVILVKGSRGMRMERTVQFLSERFE